MASLILAVPAHGQWPAWFKKPSGAVRYPEILATAGSLSAAPHPGVTFIDARPRESFEAGHIPGALNMNPRRCAPEAAAILTFVDRSGAPVSGRIVCYSDREHPEASGRLFWYLELSGRTQVQVLNGGIEAWEGAGRKLVQGDSAATPSGRGFHPGRGAVDTARIADFDYTLRNFGQPGHTIMDWRNHDEWSAAHIPHSLPFPLETLVNTDGTLKDGPAMRPFFEEFGPRLRDYVNLSDEFIVCGDTPRNLPVHPYLAARIAGIEHVRCYAEGSSGWLARHEAPIVRIVGADEVRDHLKSGWMGSLPRGESNRVLLIDLRAEGDFKQGHIPGAVWLPIDGFGAALESETARRFHWADRRKLPVIFYCYGAGCIRSRNCSTIAAQHGFLNLLWFRDGPLGWQQAGQKLVP